MRISIKYIIVNGNFQLLMAVMVIQFRSPIIYRHQMSETSSQKHRTKQMILKRQNVQTVNKYVSKKLVL